MSKIAKVLLFGIFIFSGLIKLNDPIGTQLKLEEYFDVFSVDFAFMAGFWKFWIPYALIVSILLSSLEIVLAVALALNYRIKQTLYAFVGILAFFGFLTFYSAYFNKVTDCGCFGETIKLTPWTSFGQDIFLLLLTIILLIAKKPEERKTGKWVATTAIASIALGVFCYFHLRVGGNSKIHLVQY
jgi:hypothetical protein